MGDIDTTASIVGWPYIGDVYQPVTTSGCWSVPVTPQDCSGDVHVFPCPHCDKCKCGKATVAKAKKVKR